MIRVPLSLAAAALSGAKIIARAPVEVSGICADSREVAPGDLFACLRGLHQDAQRFIPQAVQRGARALLVDRPLLGEKYPGVGIVQVPDVARALAGLAAPFYGQPASVLRLVGVTGTNGKTTTTHLIRAIAERMPATGKKRGRHVGLIGTIQHEIAGRAFAAHNTTPMAWDLQKLLYAMVSAGCDLAVMEVSSHALDQNRVADCEFDVAVFTNLTQDHLDYHRTLAAYARAKEKLFAGLAAPGAKVSPKTAVVNADDPLGPRMGRAARGVKVLTYGLKASAQVRASRVRATERGNEFELVTPRGAIDVRLPLLGEYNVSNALGAAAAGLALGASLLQIKRGLESVTSVAGRLEKVAGSQPFSVVVDFAHTPDALEKVLQNVRAWTRGSVWVVFGCGGERDAGKRPLMGEISARLADGVVLTSDNPRSEEPMKIIGQIQAGCRRAGKAGVVEPDRRRAIRYALKKAQPGDTVLLAGKGHESQQTLKDRVLAFSDRQVAQEELKKMGYGR